MRRCSVPGITVLFVVAGVTWSAGAIVGGRVDFAGAEALCRVRIYDENHQSLFAATAVIIGPQHVATSHHVLDHDGARFIKIRCGNHSIFAAFGPELAATPRGVDLAVLEFPGVLLPETRVRFARTEEEWARARASAETLWAAGFGGQSHPSPSEFATLLRTHVPSLVDPATIDRDAERLSDHFARGRSNARALDAYSRGLVSPAVLRAVEESRDERRPIAMRVRFHRERSKHAFVPIEDSTWAKTGDSGGAIFAIDADQTPVLLGIISRGGWAFGDLNPKEKMRRVRRYLRWPFRKPLIANYPASPSVFAERLVGRGQPARLTMGSCEASLAPILDQERASHRSQNPHGDGSGQPK